MIEMSVIQFILVCISIFFAGISVGATIVALLR
jgi:hypothetical protein